MTVELAHAFPDADVRALAKARREPDWMVEFREKAVAAFGSAPMIRPDKTKVTSWNFFQPAGPARVESAPYPSVDDLPEEVKRVVDLDGVAALYVQHNNAPAFLQVSAELAAQGVVFCSLEEAIRERSDLVRRYLMTEALKPTEHKAAAFHAALLNGGAFLYVPKGVQLERPIQAVYYHDDASASLINHTLLVAAEGSRVTFVENYLSAGGTSGAIANIASEVIAENGAHVAFGAVDVLAEGFTTYVTRRGIAQRDARIEWALGLMNDSDTISDNATHLLGDGSYGDMKMVVVGRGKQKQNFTTSITHWGKGSEGYILKRGVMTESASSIFNGIGKIEHGASKSNAQQESRVLMLSEKARGDANPILLIDEDDVLAGHAASVGRVDPYQLYYLMSRGIAKREAERLIIHGFLDPVVRELPIESVKRQLTEVIERKVR